MATKAATIRTDLELALEKLQQAADEMAAVLKLPREIGSKVLWSNGVTWTRVGENAWQPSNLSRVIGGNSYSPRDDRNWPSLHVAAYGSFEVLP